MFTQVYGVTISLIQYITPRKSETCKHVQRIQQDPDSSDPIQNGNLEVKTS